MDIAPDYSIELLSLISTMLSSERDTRPTATQVKQQLETIAVKLFASPSVQCRTCQSSFVSKKALLAHLKKTKHGRRAATTEEQIKISDSVAGDDAQITIRGAASGPVRHYYDDEQLDALDPSPCVVCNKSFNTKRQFFAHLGGGRHWRNAQYVKKRKAESQLSVDMGKGEDRLTKWIRKDMVRH
ncbi:hypothetical protein FB567DRAFT_516773 [Paraphoma chrysanthemicola]|uniref:C2H2-type domain-containing protein n=1 Tax=Paraphoma chrysanthemicola TaxID=798071 RepID=A0A8K0RDN5_9PLEO|nr:hypothetical protein FB567DRAFT_516773 [Paraphoma chrysanthemicola]